MKKEDTDALFVYGMHAVIEAVKRRPDAVRKLYVREDLMHNTQVISCYKHVPQLTTFVGNAVPRGVDRNAVHQGIIALIDVDILMIPFKEFRDTLTVNNDTALVILGEVQDPHNVGAIIRSAAAFGASAILVPEHRGCPITGTVIKVSAGMAFTVPLVSVGNINNALRDLKDKGFWAYGLDGGGDTELTKEQFIKPSLFIVGNEATGMRLKTHELCDTVLTIPMHARAESLNASVSAAVTLYAWSVQHPESLSKQTRGIT
ncbi:23S rRNA (guanosine(2251)-2'-O)-methyltransferase RlmB [Candidatus Pacebacteria bacterium]|nr:23S rRNA (guanosine(2251)-2'-O)-methyltransferase RlmB [Candidatus Paceibacterota bacterium]